MKYLYQGETSEDYKTGRAYHIELLTYRVRKVERFTIHRVIVPWKFWETDGLMEYQSIDDFNKDWKEL